MSEEPHPDKVSDTSEPQKINDSKDDPVQTKSEEFSSNDVVAETEQIEENLKNLAKHFEEEPEEVPRSTAKQLLITFSFILGPGLLPFAIFAKNSIFKDIMLVVSESVSNNHNCMEKVKSIRLKK